MTVFRAGSEFCYAVSAVLVGGCLGIADDASRAAIAEVHIGSDHRLSLGVGDCALHDQPFLHNEDGLACLKFGSLRRALAVAEHKFDVFVVNDADGKALRPRRKVFALPIAPWRRFVLCASRCGGGRCRRALRLAVTIPALPPATGRPEASRTTPPTGWLRSSLKVNSAGIAVKPLSGLLRVGRRGNVAVGLDANLHAIAFGGGFYDSRGAVAPCPTVGAFPVPQNRSGKDNHVPPPMSVTPIDVRSDDRLAGGIDDVDEN